MRRLKTWTTVGALLFLMAGCGGDESTSSQEAAAAESAESSDGSIASGLQGLKSLGDAMSKMQQEAERQKNFKVEPVDFRKLRDLLPEAVGGLERSEMEGQKQGMMGMTVSSAEASYTGEDRRRVTVKITDMGGVTGLALLGYGWALAEMDKESSSGYERTTTYKGHRAHEKYNSDQRRGEMQALVADRFVVEVTGRDVEMETVKEAMSAVDLGTLEGMKDEGVTRRES